MSLQENLPHAVKPIYSDAKKFCGSVIVPLSTFDLEISMRENCSRQRIIVIYDEFFSILCLLHLFEIYFKYKFRPEFLNLHKYLKIAGFWESLNTIQIALIFTDLKQKPKFSYFGKKTHKDFNMVVHVHTQSIKKNLVNTLL